MSFGPDGRPRAIVLTFDNLGEAADLERGTWTGETPLGDDPSVTLALPRLLDELDRHGLRATFFVEAINCELNPQAVRTVIRRGHELGAHGYSHETWSELSARDERALLMKATRAFGNLGTPARAFRPPGGELTAATAGLLKELGYTWCSPRGSEPAVHDGLAWIPFDWRLVDAYHLMQRFADLRAEHGDPRPAAAPGRAAELMGAALDDAGPGVQTVVLHPFLMLDAPWMEGVCGLLEVVAGLAQSGRAWVVNGREMAAWLRSRR